MLCRIYALAQQLVIRCLLENLILITQWWILRRNQVISLESVLLDIMELLVWSLGVTK